MTCKNNRFNNKRLLLRLYWLRKYLNYCTMTITKYRMITESGYIETLDKKEAVKYGSYETINEEVTDEATNNG